MEDKILNNSYNAVEYGTEGLKGTAISIHPSVAGQYEDSTTEDMEDLHIRRSLNKKMLQLYEESPFYEKYGKEDKVVERADMGDIYYYFKNKLLEEESYNMVQIFCVIAEFFQMKYKVLYNDVISLGDKAEILDTLKNTSGLMKEFETSHSLF